MHLLYLIASVLIVGALGGHGRVTNSRIQHQWKIMEFGFKNNKEKNFVADKVEIIPANALLVDVQPQFKKGKLIRTFVTTPRFATGIPYTLATVSNQKSPNGPVLQPYPSMSHHLNLNGKSCEKIISAFHVAVNECNQMWVIDEGSGDICPPKLLLFDLNTDQLIFNHTFNASVYTPEASSLFNLVLDVRDPPPSGRCKNTMIYIADVNYHGLVVYDFKANNAWRVENLFQYPNPKHATHTIAGDTFTLMDGIFGLATDKRNLYFHPFASVSEYAVPLSVLDNSTLFANKKGNMLEAFEEVGRRRSACTASAIDSKSNLYCVTLNPIELTKWNVQTPFNVLNIKKLPITASHLQFVSGMKVVRGKKGREELWMTSSRYQKRATGTRNFNEVNYRVVVYRL